MLSEQFAHFFAYNKCRKLAVFGVILYLKTVVTIFLKYYYVRLKGLFCYFQIPWIIFLFTNVILSWPVFFFSIAMDNLIQFTKRVFRSSHKRQRCRDNKELKIVIVNKQLTGLRSLFVHPCGRICTKQHTVCSWLHTWQLPSFLSWFWHCLSPCVFVQQWQWAGKLAFFWGLSLALACIPDIPKGFRSNGLSAST